MKPNFAKGLIPASCYRGRYERSFNVSLYE